MKDAGHSHAYLSLDGLRGIAALSVVALHMPRMVTPIHLPNAHLSVDFFFQLSGFVIAHAYSRKIKGGMNFAQFFAARFNRLYPAALLGGLLGIPVALTAIAHPGSGILIEWTPALLAWSVLTYFLLLPTPAVEGSQELYPLNEVMWSIFYELVTNVVYFFAFTGIRRGRLLVVAAAFVAAFIFLAVQMNSSAPGFLWRDLVFGLTRTAASFCIGLLVFNIKPNWRIESDLAAFVLGVVLAACVLCPVTNIYLQMAMTFGLFPVLLFAGVVFQPKRLAPVFATLGGASYVLYAVHKPVLQLVYGALTKLTPGLAEQYAPFTGFALLAALFVGCVWLNRTYEPYVRAQMTRFTNRWTQPSPVPKRV